MAGTDENSITAADLRLACNELAFVTKLVGSEERALKVMDSLLDDLAKGFIRWDCDSLRVNGDFQAYPSLRTAFAAARGRAFFWHRDEHSRVEADWRTSCAAWMGPLAGFGSDGRGNSWPIFDPCASTSLMASGVRSHHGDVIDRLVADRRHRPCRRQSPRSRHGSRTRWSLKTIQNRRLRPPCQPSRRRRRSRGWGRRSNGSRCWR